MDIGRVVGFERCSLQIGECFKSSQDAEFQTKFGPRSRVIGKPTADSEFSSMLGQIIEGADRVDCQ